MGVKRVKTVSLYPSDVSKGTEDADVDDKPKEAFASDLGPSNDIVANSAASSAEKRTPRGNGILPELEACTSNQP